MNDSGGDVAAAVGGQLRAVATHLELVLDERVPAHDLVERDAARALIYAARDAAAALEAVAIPDRRDLPAGVCPHLSWHEEGDESGSSGYWVCDSCGKAEHVAAHPAQPLPEVCPVCGPGECACGMVPNRPAQPLPAADEDWPCDNYTEPYTCLTARPAAGSECRICRIRAADRLIAALKTADEAGVVARVEALARKYHALAVESMRTFIPTIGVSPLEVADELDAALATGTATQGGGQ